MSKIIEKIVKKENLLWAWKKAKRAYQIGDIWFNEIELAEFEINLNAELSKIKEEILEGTFQLNKIKPIPFPKGYDTEKEEARTRQTFLFAVRDQVVWLAVVNIIGPELDYQMPSWSYGNRLFISVWYENENNKDVIKFGWYRNSHGNIYRKWNQSWPLYRRHISLTTRIMANAKSFNEDPIKAIDENIEEVAEKIAFENNELTNNHLKVEYLTKDYWEKDANFKKLYWASIDLEKFYPKTKVGVILKNIKTYYLGNVPDVKFEKLLSELLNFRLDIRGWKEPEELKDIQIFSNDFDGIPTGLFVAGFLANVALLEVDCKVNEILQKDKNIAHFRFVDDHVFLSYDFEQLSEWVLEYEKLLEKFNTGAVINITKTEPTEFANYLNKLKIGEDTPEIKNAAKKSTVLNPKFPSPLMTQTLAKVSAINNTEFDLLTENEEKQLIADLEHLLITDFPDHELRKDTRISFAATMLSRLIPRKRKDYSGIYELRKDLSIYSNKHKKEIEKLRKNTSELLFSEFNNAIHLDKYQVDNKLLRSKTKFAKEACTFIIGIKEEEKKIFKSIEDDSVRLKKYIFELILKAAKENHQKVRLWVRLIEYCSQTGYAPFGRIIDEIDELKGNGISSCLSNSFLYSLVMSVIADRILNRTSYLLNSKFNSEEEKSSYYKFIEEVYQENFLKKVLKKQSQEPKEYFQISFQIFMLVISTLPQIANDNEIKIDVKRINKSLTKLKLEKYCLFQKTDIKNINSFIIWFVNKLQGHNRVDINTKLLPVISLLNKNQESAISLIKLTPDYSFLEGIIDVELLNKALTNISNEGWFFDLAKSILAKDDKKDLLNLILDKHKNIKHHIEFEDKNFLSIYDWVSNLNDNIEKNNHSLFDPSISEWTCLQIIIQITEGIDASRKKDFLNLFNLDLKDPIHPSNYLMPIVWLNSENKRSWETWKSTVRDNPIKMRDREVMITDERYTPESLTQFLDNTLSVVFGLGIMLFSLLIRNTRLPWMWNSEEQNFALPNLIKSKLKDISVSSYTYAIIDACLSNKDKETFLWIKSGDNQVKGFIPSDDTLKESPHIRSLEDLKIYCSKACEILEKYQISVQDNLPRQLIPISFEQLSNSNNPFIENKENLS
ncbi:MAG: RNA-directed DNA polymerase [Bacteroidales bacterium]|nr:RNA-directed DNA polymerase [Bacteroidales bacterium]